MKTNGAYVWVLILMGWLAMSAATLAGEVSGRIVGVTDGDTLTLLVDGRQQYKVRLAGIDAPEKRQAFGQKSKQRLAELSFRRHARVEWSKRDRYNRIVGKVLVDGNDVGLQMIRMGMAWHFKRYANEQTPSDRLMYSQAEEQARASQIGLWRDISPVEPWTFRSDRRVY